jgi:uncharacterized lipoprotein YehR (DUF1307 family)
METPTSPTEVLKARLASWLKYRELWEAEWTRDYNRYYNVFQKELTSTEGDDWHSKEVYPVVRKKVKTANAIVEKTLYSTGRMPFDLAKTPVQDENQESKITQKHGIDPNSLIDAMKDKIDDAYVESKAVIQVRRATRMLPVYGTCVVYGPVGKKIGSNSWSAITDNDAEIPNVLEARANLPPEQFQGLSDEDLQAYDREAIKTLEDSYEVTMMNTEFELTESEKIVPHLRYCDLWDIVLDPEGRNAQEGRGIFEIRRVHKSDVALLVNEMDEDGKPIYDKKSIQSVMGSTEKIWQTYQRGPHRVKTDEQLDEEYVDLVLYSGVLTERELGRGDSDIPVEVLATFIGEYMIMIRDNESRRKGRPYHSCVWTECEGSPYGYGLAYELEDPAKTMNSMVRLANDNIRLHGSPPITIDKRFVKNPDIKLSPGAEIETRDGAKANEILDVHIYPNVTASIVDYMRFVDDWANSASGLPDILEGDSIGNKANTAYEAGILKESAMNQLGLAIQAIDDDLITPITEAYYDWVMNYDKDKTIKGEFQIIATGFKSFENNFKARQTLMTHLQLSENPKLSHYYKPEEIIKRIAEIDGLDDSYIATKEEASESMQAMYEQQMQQLQGMIAELQGQLKEKGSKLEIDSRKVELESSFKAAKLEADQKIAEDKIQADLIKEGMKHESPDA